MQKIFEEYGGVIVSAIAIVALIGVVTLLVGGTNGGWIGTEFKNLVDSFIGEANEKISAIQ